jgi:hypothetical protein
MKFLLSILFSFYAVIIFGQGSANLHFIPMWQGNSVSHNSFFAIGNNADSLRVSALRFYVYNIQLRSKNRLLWTSGNNHFLIDVFENDQAKSSMMLPDLSNADELWFTIGVDSMLQTAGAQTGALDAIHGMYWAWQSGYIAWKFEAEEKRSQQSNKIQWHVGGFRAPFKTERTVRLELNDNRGVINCGVQLDQLLSQWEQHFPAEVMSPNNSAMLLANRFQTCFKLLVR